MCFLCKSKHEIIIKKIKKIKDLQYCVLNFLIQP